MNRKELIELIERARLGAYSAPNSKFLLKLADALESCMKENKEAGEILGYYTEEIERMGIPTELPYPNIYHSAAAWLKRNEEHNE